MTRGDLDTATAAGAVALSAVLAQSASDVANEEGWGYPSVDGEARIVLTAALASLQANGWSVVRLVEVLSVRAAPEANDAGEVTSHETIPTCEGADCRPLYAVLDRLASTEGAE